MTGFLGPILSPCADIGKPVPPWGLPGTKVGDGAGYSAVYKRWTRARRSPRGRCEPGAGTLGSRNGPTVHGPCGSSRRCADVIGVRRIALTWRSSVRCFAGFAALNQHDGTLGHSDRLDLKLCSSVQRAHPTSQFRRSTLGEVFGVDGVHFSELIELREVEHEAQPLHRLPDDKGRHPEAALCRHLALDRGLPSPLDPAPA
jgi:hypothetical protein